MTTAFILIVAAFAFGFFAAMGSVFGRIAAGRWLNLLKDRSDTP